MPARVRRYFLVYLFFALAVLPSAVFSLAPGYSFPKYVDYFVVRFLVLVMLLFLKIDGEAIKKALLCLIAFLAVDGLATLGERLITQAARAHGLGDGWLRHASIVATVFPASIILWLSRKADIPHKNGLLLCAFVYAGDGEYVL